MTIEEKAELNRRVSELREPIGQPLGGNWRYVDHWLPCLMPRDWTDDPAANATLRDELIANGHNLVYSKEGFEWIIPKRLSHSGITIRGYLHIPDDIATHSEGVVKAWLAWKEVV